LHWSSLTDEHKAPYSSLINENTRATSNSVSLGQPIRGLQVLRRGLLDQVKQGQFPGLHGGLVVLQGQPLVEIGDCLALSSYQNTKKNPSKTKNNKTVKK
jgi:hypothetical protein